MPELLDGGRDGGCPCGGVGEVDDEDAVAGLPVEADHAVAPGPEGRGDGGADPVGGARDEGGECGHAAPSVKLTSRVVSQARLSPG